MVISPVWRLVIESRRRRSFRPCQLSSFWWLGRLPLRRRRSHRPPRTGTSRCRSSRAHCRRVRRAETWAAVLRTLVGVGVGLGGGEGLAGLRLGWLGLGLRGLGCDLGSGPGLGPRIRAREVQEMAEALLGGRWLPSRGASRAALSARPHGSRRASSTRRPSPGSSRAPATWRMPTPRLRKQSTRLAHGPASNLH